ncbi:MAG: OadG family protein [Oscillospiraceae bacterium]|jgi:Na+-transporting methylmalonyl-CoA/oxaloacetate decarboxylase gamma subunit|nr:OadG family protein [Oscillospiraceae bacterium]
MHITQLTVPEALLYALVGITAVMTILLLLSLLIRLISRAVTFSESLAKKRDAVVLREEIQAPAAAGQGGIPLPEGESQGKLTLVETDEATAALLMAVVSDSSGIPLNRLAFKTIRRLPEATEV